MHDTAKLVTGTAVAAGTMSAIPVPHTSVIGTVVIGYVIPLAMSLLSHLILNLFKSKTDVNKNSGS